jgi:cation diffusion facilitator CzcD-associated flavoprotein CzcO
MTTVSSNLPVAVIGAGPVGLAAAAHLVGRGLTPLVFEAGASVAAHLESYRHVQLFSPLALQPRCAIPAPPRRARVDGTASPPLAHSRRDD